MPTVLNGAGATMTRELLSSAVRDAAGMVVGTVFNPLSLGPAQPALPAVRNP
jgi:hypothetical protein